MVLVDEYDKPILDPLTDSTARAELAHHNRDALRALYGNVKELDAHIRFALLTGVSKFSKVSLFSELNNLADITLDPRYATICGYTEHDLDAVFAPELEGLDREDIRDWYNGYSWLGAERVYNPFGILRLFRLRRFAPHWFETGSPRFLVDKLKERGVGPLQLDDVVASDALLSAFDVDHMSRKNTARTANPSTWSGSNSAHENAILWRSRRPSDRLPDADAAVSVRPRQFHSAPIGTAKSRSPNDVA